MFLSKANRQSARVMGHVLNFPLYDGDCSPVARELLAVGDIDGAIAEWRRLADLGSGPAPFQWTVYRLSFLTLSSSKFFRKRSLPPKAVEALGFFT
jgi:hypothetical protein